MKKLFLYFVLVYFIFWIIWLFFILLKFGINVLFVLLKYYYYFGLFGFMIVVFVVKYILDGWKGIMDLLKRIV